MSTKKPRTTTAAAPPTEEPDTSAVPETDDDPLGALLSHLKQARGFDFTGYKRSSVERRVGKRMEALAVEDYHAYVDYLEVHPEEYGELFDTLLINVTTFFRDMPSWDYLASDIVPQLLARKGADGTLRVWCAGCASGEEAYTIAMVLAEAMGAEAFMRRVKIYATDIDDDALTTARNGTYSARKVDNVPQPLLERYFERGDHGFTFRKDLRRTVIFGRNDLVQDAPISRIDLLVCRNTLMYFNAETQGKILGRFSFALDADGFLFLGRSEMLITHGDLFVPVSLKRRVFTRVTATTLRDRLLSAAHAHEEHRGEAGMAIRESSYEAAPIAQIAFDPAGILALANRRARQLFDLAAGDLGRPLKDLGIAYRPIELRDGMDQALAERRPVTLGPASWTAAGGETVELEALIAPLTDGEATLGTSVAYADVTAQKRLREEVESSRRELEEAYEELQSTVEELETTNEELQSTNEELETTNEELQSTVEELETTNEELQSTNEELETTNDEMRQRSVELDQVNAFLETILTSLGVAVIVLDRSGQIEIWNAYAEELWGLRQQEAIGQHLLALDIGLPVEQLKQPIRTALDDANSRGQVVLPGTTRRGKAIECTVTCLPLSVDNSEATGVILLIESRETTAQPN